MKQLLRIEIVFPALLCVAIVGVAVYATCFSPAGPWYIAYYPPARGDAFAIASYYATAIAETDSVRNTVTLYSPTSERVEQLRHSGAILIDPKGVALCYQ